MATPAGFDPKILEHPLIADDITQLIGKVCSLAGFDVGGGRRVSTRRLVFVLAAAKIISFFPGLEHFSPSPLVHGCRSGDN